MQVAVEFDRGQFAVAAQQRQGQCALARADLDDAIAWPVGPPPARSCRSPRGRAGSSGRDASWRGSVNAAHACIRRRARSVHARIAANRLDGSAAPRAGQFERRAMVDGDARVGQAQGDVHGIREIAVLEHRQSLVVVHRQHRIETGQLFGQEGGIGGQRADQVACRLPRSASRVGSMMSQFLIAQVAGFPGVRDSTRARRCVGSAMPKSSRNARMHDAQDVAQCHRR